MNIRERYILSARNKLGSINMKCLIDKSTKDIRRKMELHPDLVCGQLITPLTGYKNAGEEFAIDNGCYIGFNQNKFNRILAREKENKHRCLFVTVPDVVGNARRTLEIWKYRHRILSGWPLALVMQNGMEDIDIPWNELSAIFMGGNDPWKDSKTAVDIVKTAKILGKHAHVGRVNSPKRFKLYRDAGADTCDGSGISMYDHMLDEIQKSLTVNDEPRLFGDDDA